MKQSSVSTAGRETDSAHFAYPCDRNTAAETLTRRDVLNSVRASARGAPKRMKIVAERNGSGDRDPDDCQSRHECHGAHGRCMSIPHASDAIRRQGESSQVDPFVVRP